MAKNTKAKLIIFDLDDTLVAAESCYDASLIEIGINPQDPLFLMARQKVKERLPNLAPVARSRFLYLKTFLELSNQYTAKLSLKLGEDYERLVIDKMTKCWIDLGRAELFRNLKQTGVHLAVLSNETCRLQTKKLASIQGPDNFFEFLLTSEERGVEKPEKKLFEEILKHFNVDASEAFMVGDSFDNDIQPCLDLKIRCTQSVEFRKSDQVYIHNISKLEQLLEYL